MVRGVCVCVLNRHLGHGLLGVPALVQLGLEARQATRERLVHVVPQLALRLGRFIQSEQKKWRDDKAGRFRTWKASLAKHKSSSCGVVRSVLDFAITSRLRTQTPVSADIDFDSSWVYGSEKRSWTNGAFRQ